MALPMLAERGRHWFRKLRRRKGLSSEQPGGQVQEEEGYSWAGDGGHGGRTQSQLKVGWTPTRRDDQRTTLSRASVPLLRHQEPSPDVWLQLGHQVP